MAPGRPSLAWRGKNNKNKTKNILLEHVLNISFPVPEESMLSFLMKHKPVTIAKQELEHSNNKMHCPKF